MEREPSTPSDRIRWAIDQTDFGLESIAAKIGCSHAALSFWQTGKTNLHNVKVGLLMEFCKVTGTNLQWLLTGDGPRLTHYPRADAFEAPLISAARRIVQDMSPAMAETAYRLLAALDPPAVN